MKAKMVSDGSEQFGLTINIREHRSQWGAWRAYFKKKKIPCKFMSERAREDFFTKGDEEKGYQVPAEWPHQFDADQSEHIDFQAADNFLNSFAQWERKQLGDDLTPDQRKGGVQRALSQSSMTTRRHKLQKPISNGEKVYETERREWVVHRGCPEWDAWMMHSENASADTTTMEMLGFSVFPSPWPPEQPNPTTH